VLKRSTKTLRFLAKLIAFSSNSRQVSSFAAQSAQVAIGNTTTVSTL
jgi:hypothetical protein